MRPSTGLVLLVAASATSTALADTTVFVVRHAEKVIAKDAPDPPLTKEGRARAERLANLLRSVPLSAVYTTRFRRNRETVAPTAERHKLRPTEYETKGYEALARTLRSRHPQGHVLVAGHSNTVPGILAALGAKTPPQLEEDDYDNLFVVRMAADGSASLMRLHFGRMTP